MKKTTYTVFALFGVVGVLSIVQVILSNSLSTTGGELKNLDLSMNEYRTKNAVLREEILKLSSLTSIASQASRLGFVESKSEVYLSTPLPLALKQ